MRKTGKKTTKMTSKLACRLKINTYMRFGI